MEASSGRTRARLIARDTNGASRGRSILTVELNGVFVNQVGGLVRESLVGAAQRVVESHAEVLGRVSDGLREQNVALDESSRVPVWAAGSVSRAGLESE